MKKAKKILGMLVVVLLVASLLAIAAFAEGADPTGASYTALTGNETLSDVATTANQALYGANYTWVMYSQP